MYGSDLPPELQICITISTSACPKCLCCSPWPTYPTRSFHSHLLSPLSHQALSRLPLGCLNSSHFLASFCPHPRPSHHLKPEQPHSLSVPANLLSTRSHCVNPQPLKTLQSFGGIHFWFSVAFWPAQAPFYPLHPSLCSTASVPQTASSHQGLHVCSYHYTETLATPQTNVPLI